MTPSENSRRLAALRGEVTKAQQTSLSGNGGNRHTLDALHLPPTWDNSSSAEQDPRAALLTRMGRRGLGVAVMISAVSVTLIGASIWVFENSRDRLQADVTSATPVQVKQDLFMPPSSIPALVARVTGSTVVIECADSQGSGFAVNTRELGGTSVAVVTNNHVIETCPNPDDLKITASDGIHVGAVLESDQKNDLAILAVPGLAIEAMKVDLAPQVGEWAMAVGAPLGISNTASFGYVTNVKMNEMLITTDAVLGPGNSGGPLVNSAGDVIGINSAVFVDATGISIVMPVKGLCLRLIDCN